MNGIELGVEGMGALSAKNLIFQGDGGPTPATQAPGSKGIPPGVWKDRDTPAPAGAIHSPSLGQPVD